LGRNHARNVSTRLNIEENKALKQEMVSQALTLVDHAAIFPLENQSIACVTAGTGRGSTAFTKELSRYGIKQHYFAKSSLSASRIKQLAKKEVVIVAVHNIGKDAKSNFGVASGVRKAVEALSAKTKVLVVTFGTPYALKNFPTAQGALVAFNEETLTQKLAARGIAGALPFRGRLPVSGSAKFQYGMGKDTEVQKMMYASNPEAVGLNTTTLSRIDKIAAEMIREKAAPGCQVLVAKDGKIAFHRTYGYYDYQKKKRVKLENVYDLASVTSSIKLG